MKGAPMGVKAEEALEVSYEDLPMYLHANHSMYMEWLACRYMGRSS